jgi:hypothetical protein
MVVEVDEVVTAVDVQWSSTRQFVQSAIKNVRFLLSRAETVRYSARIVFPNVKIAAVNFIR